MLNENQTCPLCLREAFVSMDPDFQFKEITCSRCGIFQTNSPSIMFNNKTNIPLINLSGISRFHHERGQRLRITDENRADLEKSAPKSALDKSKWLLQAITFRTRYPGDEILFNPNTDYPLVFATTPDEFGFFLQYLEKAGLLASGVNPRLRVVTLEGWSAVEKSKAVGLDSNKAFVAMWFDESMTECYKKAIEPAIELDAGFESIRVDALAHNDKIDDRIIAEIRESRFVVADFTGQRGGVYFEAGFAHGMGIPVIWLCREDEIGKVHFDTRQYNHITWTTPAELRSRLADRIKATIGRGRNKALP